MQEIVTAGDLFSYIESKNGKLREVEAAVIIRQILVALSFLHSKNIVHRDIKPDNVLMTSLAAGSRVILTDFGAARRIESKMHRMSSINGTHEYAAPYVIPQFDSDVTDHTCSEILGYLRSNAEPEKPGYTRAVDMWAVGCVTVVLLTGGLAFCDPVTHNYSEKLAKDCNLEFLRRSKEWKVVRQRPAEFVEKLLVLDEDRRLSAEEALQHSWFYNEVHKNDFEELYQRTIKHWRPRIPKSNVVEFQDNGSIRTLACSRDFARPPRRSMGCPQPPVEPPYKPFPRKMHQVLWPPRSPTKGLSEEALSAMERSSPNSATLLRITAEIMSPRLRSDTSSSRDLAATGASRNATAASEPPPVLRRRSPMNLSTHVLEPAILSVSTTSQRIQHGAGQTEPVVRPPTPKPPRRLSADGFETPLKPVLSFANPISHVPSAAEQASWSFPQGSIANTAAQPIVRPNVLRSVGNSMEIQPTFHDETEPSANPHIRTPQKNSKLKRRSSTPLTTPTFKRRRSSSVFDLAEDSDTEVQYSSNKHPQGSVLDVSDGNRGNILRVPRLPLAHRPKDAPATPRSRSPPTNLYLPR